MTNNNNTEAICEECLKKTKIGYQGDGSFFDPQLKGINYLQLGKSKMLHNPLLIFFEWCYREYVKLKAAFKRLKEFLFPRRSKIWCNRADSYLSGQIHYADYEERHRPIHHLKVELWGRTQWLQWRKLGEAYSGEDGVFKLPYELRQARNWKIYRLQFEIYQTTHIYFAENKPSPVLNRCYMEKVPASDLTGMGYNLRTIRLHLWEYRKDTLVPRTEIINLNNNSPQYYAQGRVNALMQQVAPIELIKYKHLVQIKKAPETISIASIQADYPENLTVCIEKKLPGYTRSDEWFGLRMMNGMNKGAFLPDKENPAHYWIKYFGVCGYPHTDLYALPTIEIKFKLSATALPLPIEIHIIGPTNAFNKDPWQHKVFTPESGEEWMYAKRVARVTGSFSTEVDEHFCGTHLNTEQFALAAYRNFRLSPLACLLFPHLKEVALVNHSADKILIHGYIPSATAITQEGLNLRTRDVLGMQDWKGWKPMKPISEAHSCAKAEQLFWEITQKYVNDFIEDNLPEIKKHWLEVYQFSEDLVSHAVPVFMSDIDWAQLSPQEKKLAEDRLEYYSLQYGFDRTLPREMVEGKLRAMSPITKVTEFKFAAPDDLNNLKQACSYAIMMATYLHTWINEHQYDDLGEVMYSSGGLRFGDKERGILAPESDLSISPDLTRATEMLWFTNFLSRTEYGFITKNEEGDINPIFKDLLAEKREEFLALGVDIDSIESRTNI